jgi:UDP-N-acetylmuramoyl-tripeptide--D-alanyl-D-alanine ligase
MYLPLVEIAELLGMNDIVSNAIVTGAKIDSRAVESGDLFVALPGEKVDGHDYIAKARESGAVAALVSVKQDDELPQIVVDDVVKAFGEIAAYWLKQCQAKVVAITGSNGKTTVKEMTASILRQHGNVLATAGNLNNDLGVPLTICRLSKEDQFAVLEMGASGLGHIERLVTIAKPDVSIINNVAPAHLEGFGSLQGVAKAKGEIYTGLSMDGVAVVNADMPYQAIWDESLEGKAIVTFAINSQADVMAQDTHFDVHASHFMVKLDDQFHYINLPLPGIHNVSNALAAIAICYSLNVPTDAIVKGLETVQSAPHRLQLRAGVNGSQLLDDTYNANQASFTQALTVLKGYPTQHWLVLGDFGELGSDSKAIHQGLGEEAKAAGIHKLLTIGQQSQLAAHAFGEQAMVFETHSELEAFLHAELDENTTCLIKGSRFMQLDKLADALASKEQN